MKCGEQVQYGPQKSRPNAASNPENILLGVEQGQSARIWLTYFTYTCNGARQPWHRITLCQFKCGGSMYTFYKNISFSSSQTLKLKMGYKLLGHFVQYPLWLCNDITWVSKHVPVFAGSWDKCVPRPCSRECKREWSNIPDKRSCKYH